MARNEEKHFCKLNRIILQQMRDVEKKKNPPRPKLCTLNSVDEIKKWLPTIERDIDFCLKQSQVTCYPESKIQEYLSRIDKLQFEYKSYVRKVRELDPTCTVIPWTERSYSNRKRSSASTDNSETAVKLPKETQGRKQTLSVKDTLTSDEANVKFERLKLPVLDGETELEYKKAERKPVVESIEASQDLPLTFCIQTSLKTAPPQSYHSTNSYDTTEINSTRKANDNQEKSGFSCITKISSNPLGINYSSSDDDTE